MTISLKRDNTAELFFLKGVFKKMSYLFYFNIRKISFCVLFLILSINLLGLCTIITSANNGNEKSSSPDYFSGDLRFNDDGDIIIGTEQDESKTLVDTLNDILRRYNNFIVGISGIGALTMLVNFIIQFIKLGGCSNPGRRSEIITGLITSAVATAGLGSVAFIVGFFYSSLS